MAGRREKAARESMIEEEEEEESIPVTVCYKCQQEGHFGRECIYEERPKLNTCSLSEVIIRTTRITFQISASVLFMMLYHLMKNDRLPSIYVFEGCWTTVILGQTIYQAHKNLPFLLEHGYRRIGVFILQNEQCRVTMCYLVASFVLAPVLRTLTQTISTDTIHAVSIGLLFAHLLTNDYGVPGFLVSRTMSINAAIIAAICLSSRLPTDKHSMALITLAIEVFVLFPIFSSIIWDSKKCLVIIVSIVAFTCYITSSQIFLVYVGSVAFITLILPLIFVVSQKFKYNMYGPWDEAVVENEQ